MIWLVLFVLFVLLIVAAAWLASQQGAGALPYTRRAALFSPAERSFLGVLEQAVGAQYRIFGKVRVADVVGVQKMNDRAAWQRAFNRISAKHFDFILCDPKDLSVIAAIELNDRSHKNPKRQQRDDFLTRVCESIELPLIQLPARRGYQLDAIKETIATALPPAQPD